MSGLVNSQTKRIEEIVDFLLKTKQVKSERAFALSINLDPAAFSAAKKGKRNIPEKKLDTISTLYNVNIKFIKHGQMPMFLPPEPNSNENNTYKENVNQKATLASGFSLSSPRREPDFYKSPPPNPASGTVFIKINSGDLFVLRNILNFAKEHLPFSDAKSKDVQTTLADIQDIYPKLIPDTTI